MRFFVKYLQLLMVLIIVSACGGGGVSDLILWGILSESEESDNQVVDTINKSGAVPFENRIQAKNIVDAGGTIVATGRSIEGNFILSANNMVTNISTSESPAAVFASKSDFILETNNTSWRFSSNEFDSFYPISVFSRLETESAKEILSFEGLDYTNFGLWLESPRVGKISPNVFGAYYVGVPTGVNLPASGQANYRGASLGLYLDRTSVGYVVTSEVTALANFSTRTIGFSTNQSARQQLSPVGSAINAPELNITGQLTIVPGSSAFSGTFTTNNGMVGSSKGEFLGPGAKEIGGIFNLKGSDMTTYVGSYGATK